MKTLLKWSVVSLACLVWSVPIVSALLVEQLDMSLPVVDCASKWAQSGDEVHVFVKWALKIDAPARNDMARDRVEIQMNSDSVSLYAQYKNIKIFRFEVSLAEEIDPDLSSFEIKTFGIHFVFKKMKLQNVWPGLLSKESHVPKNMHRWWELYEQWEPELASLQTKTEDELAWAWLQSFPSKCEACRMTLEQSLYSNRNMKTFQDLDSPPPGKSASRRSYNKTMISIIRSTCKDENFVLEEENADSGVRIKGASVGASGWSKENTIITPTPEMKRACFAITANKEIASELIGVGTKIHEDVLEAAKHENVEMSFASMKKSELGVSSILSNHDSICVETLGLCESRPPADLDSQCRSCKIIVNDVREALLRYAESADEARQLETLNNVCASIPWRHGEIRVLKSTCESLVDEHEDDLLVLLRTLNGVPVLEHGSHILRYCGKSGFCAKKSKKSKKRSRAKKEL